MLFIPCIPEPEPDELLYGYICRVAKANGMNPEEFGAYYLGHDKANKRHLKIDLGYDFVRFFEMAHLDISMLDMYQGMSTFSFEAISMQENRQLRYINSIFCPPNTMNASTQSIYEPARICPKCAMEDMEKYGHVYLHREHNLSGVCVCSRHGCKLMQYKGRAGHECDYDFDDYEEMETSLPLEDALGYAVYAKALLNSGISTNIYNIKTAIMDKIKNGQRSTRGPYDKFVDSVSKWEHSALFDGLDMDHRLRHALSNATNMSMRETVPFLMYLYPDMNELIRACQNEEPILLEYVCEKCGKVYCSSPRAQKEGWGCPYCAENVPVKERFEQLVESAGNGQYVPLDPFESMQKKIRFLHKKCGETFYMTPASFLMDGARCPCNRTVTEREARKFTEAHGFKLLSFTKASEKAVFYDNDCGQEFECIYSTFAQNPFCRACGGNSWRTPESFKYRVKQLVGDEYSVLTDFVDKHTKVAIRHNACGHVHEYRPDAFLEGQRCPDCREPVLHEDMEAMLEAYSGGRYIITKYAKSSCFLRNTETREEFKLLTTRLLQEMRRPTPSPVLPVDESKRKELPPSTWDKYYQLLVEYKQEHGTARISDRGTFRGVNLGVWSRNQRAYYKNGTLSIRRYNKLNEIGFPWDLSLDIVWQQKFEILKEYQEEYGTHVPATVQYKGMHLGEWAVKQRRMFRDGSLTAERKEMLDSIGFVFEPGNAHGYESGWSSKKLDRAWEKHYKMLQKYKEEHDITYISTDAVFKNFKIGLWCQTQRLNRERGCLLKWREEKLDQIGFAWTQDRNEKLWDDHFRLLQQYKEEYGNVDTPCNRQFRDFNLGKWCSRQRNAHRAGSLSKEHTEKLEAIGFKWRLPVGVHR